MSGRRQAYQPGPLVWTANLAATCGVLFLFQKTLWLVLPFILALIIYYLLLPLKLRLVLLGLSHDRATTLSVLAALVLCALLFVLALPYWVIDLATLQESVARYLAGGLRLIGGMLTELEGRFAFLAEAQLSARLQAQLNDFFAHFAEQYLPALMVGIASWSPSLVLAPFIAFFMLRDGWRFRRFLLRAVPNAYFERSLYVLDGVDRTARLYFIGLLQLTALDTLCLALGLALIGISGAFALGLVTAVLAWVPYIGSVLGCVLVLLVAATDFPGQPAVAYAAIGLFVAVRLLDDFVFMPLTIGKSLNMHPLLTVLMIFVGGAVAGIPGLMLVLPVLGVIMVLGETLGFLLTDPRLRARHAHGLALRRAQVTRDLPGL